MTLDLSKAKPGLTGKRAHTIIVDEFAHLPPRWVKPVEWIGTALQLLGCWLLASRFATPPVAYIVMTAGSLTWMILGLRMANRPPDRSQRLFHRPQSVGHSSLEPEPMSHHSMIDLETFGTGERAAIVQVGIVAFDPEGEGIIDKEQWTVWLDSSIRLGGVVDGDTIQNFWMKQPDKARLSVADPSHKMEDALVGLATFHKHHGCRRAWSHGASFDLAILQGYYKRARIDCPWHYGDGRDTRTLFEDAANLAGWVKVKVETAHTAAADAEAQALDVQSAYRALRNLGLPPAWSPTPEDYARVRLRNVYGPLAARDHERENQLIWQNAVRDARDCLTITQQQAEDNRPVPVS